MATKKKTTTKEVKRLAFNKKNTLALADQIYSEKGGVMNILCLCDGELSNGKVGGRTTHCAVGEAYFNFVSTTMPKKSGDGSETDVAVAKLVEVAQLKKDTDENRRKLQSALDNAVSENDDGSSDNAAGEYAARAYRVAEVFRKEVAPLLK